MQSQLEVNRINLLLKGRYIPRRVIWEHQQEIKRWLWVMLICVTAYFASRAVMISALAPPMKMYFGYPLVWLLAGVGAFIVWRTQHPFRTSQSLKRLVAPVLIGCLHIALMCGAGLLYGFGASPYAHDLGGMLGNAIHVFSQLIALELARACTIATLGRRSVALPLFVATAAFTLLKLPHTGFNSFYDLGSALQFTGTVFLPTLANSALASMLMFTGGPVSSITYLAIVAGFEWFSPVLPALGWMPIAFIGTIVPAIGLLVIESTSQPELILWDETLDSDDGSDKWWLAAAALAVFMLYFNNGYLGVRPTMISGVSMQPTFFAGDVVISQTTTPALLEVGDIIVFRAGANRIVHRIISIQNDGPELTFVTRGDNNAQDDPLVQARHVEGRVTVHIPKIGWITIVFRRLLDQLLH